YLHRYWPASSSNGKVIDLYDDAIFKGPNLEQLHGCLSRASHDLENKPSSWKELIGRRGLVKLYAPVKKGTLQEYILLLQEAIVIAQKVNGELHFIGD